MQRPTPAPPTEEPLVAYTSGGRDVATEQVCDDDQYLEYRYLLAPGLYLDVECGTETC